MDRSYIDQAFINHTQLYRYHQYKVRSGSIWSSDRYWLKRLDDDENIVYTHLDALSPIQII